MAEGIDAALAGADAGTRRVKQRPTREELLQIQGVDANHSVREDRQDPRDRGVARPAQPRASR